MKTTVKFIIKGGCLLAALLASAALAASYYDADWNAEDRATLATLHLKQLPPVPADPSNRVEGKPQAIALGKQLFFDTRLSRNGAVSCASCHDPSKQFQDGRAVGQGVGTGIRRTMTAVAAGHSAFLFWDGRKDSLWSQAVGPLEDQAEHGGNRLAYAHLMQAHYREQYEAIFGTLPELGHLPSEASPLGTPEQKAAWNALDSATRHDISLVLANIGKAIAAYEKTLGYGESRFDKYVEGVLTNAPTARGIFAENEKNGLRIFIGKGRCVTCHSGPLFTDQSFHNTGVTPHGPGPARLGRRTGAAKALADEFNCLGRFSDTDPEKCAELRFITSDDPMLDGAFKTPGLRNVALRAPYMHAGQIKTLTEVVEHYRKAPDSSVGQSELRRVKLSEQEIRDIVAFLHTLSGPIVEEPTQSANRR